MACGVLSWRELVRIPHTRPVFVADTGPSQGLLRVLVHRLGGMATSHPIDSAAIQAPWWAAWCV